VLAAILRGRVDLERLENWRKLRREMEFLERKIDPAAKREEKQRIKQMMRGMRRIYRDREKR
jgi:ribosome biogenesis GTPase